MKTENNIRVQMIRMSDNYVPFVKVDYLDKDAREHTGLMLVDSGSNDSILASELADICMLKKDEDKVCRVYTISGDFFETTKVKFPFVLGNHQICEDFGLCDDFHKTVFSDMSIIGVIGLNLLCNHGLVIDYANGFLHTSDVNPSNLTVADCEYFFPLEIGLNCYGLPVVAIRQNNADLVMLADTGATNNAIAVQSLKENGFKHSYFDSKDVITGLNGGVEVDQATVDFNLLTLNENNDEAELPHNDLFKVMPRYIIQSDEVGVDEKGDKLPPIEGVISSSFMAKEGWVLDFGAKIIYKRKPKYVWDGNIRVNMDNKLSKSGKEKIRFYTDASKVGMPFVLITEGEYAGLVLLIDTGSNDNIIFGYTYNQIKDSLTPIEGNGYVYGIDGIRSEVHYAAWKPTFCGKQYEMRFIVKQDDSAFSQLSNDMGFPVAGIIGTKFMVEHGWVLDFGKQEVLIPNTDVSVENFRKINADKA